MASERARVKRDVIQSTAETVEPAEYVEVLSEGQASQHEIVREANRSKEAILRMELDARAEDKRSDLGMIGRYIGGKENSPVSIALVAVICGILAAFLCFHYAAVSPSASEPWIRAAEGCLAFASSALAFIFGRSGRR